MIPGATAALSRGAVAATIPNNPKNPRMTAKPYPIAPRETGTSRRRAANIISTDAPAPPIGDDNLVIVVTHCIEETHRPSGDGGQHLTSGPISQLTSLQHGFQDLVARPEGNRLSIPKHQYEIDVLDQF